MSNNISRLTGNNLTNLKGNNMPTTGETCKVSGIYKVVNHIRHPKQITMVKGHTYPPCSECSQRVQYELVRKKEH